MTEVVPKLDNAYLILIIERDRGGSNLWRPCQAVCEMLHLSLACVTTDKRLKPRDSPYDVFGVEFFPAFFVIARLLQFGQPCELISIIHFF
ncbi:MAG: hypothetical protein HN494_06225 [Opitutae bacterium]|nr:hypothetical protein [Opitutae bacterium]